MESEDHTPDYEAVTETQQTTWARGDFHEIARQNVAWLRRCVRPPVPTPGSGCSTCAVGDSEARRGAPLLRVQRHRLRAGSDRARKGTRAAAEGLEADFRVADVQALPFAEASFDVALSVYGVQFAHDQRKAASELLRVCRPGGRIALASQMPEGWSGDFFAAHGRDVPSPSGVESPLRWGTEEASPSCLAGATARLRVSPDRRSSTSARLTMP